MILTLGAGGMSEPFDGIKVPQSECDVRNRLDVLTTIAQYEPETVILTAGVSNPGPIETARYEDEIEINFLGAFNVAQACVRSDVQTLIFIASVAGLFGKPNHSAYSATKAGVISLVQSLAMEGHNAYAISPGRVNTPMREKDYPADTPGSRLEPERIWQVVQAILHGDYSPGDNVVCRKQGLVTITEQVAPTPWKQNLRVGLPVTI